jgi:hypothetical protein
MKRREFIGLIGGSAAWPVGARAQQRAFPIIGVLHGVSAAQWADRMIGFDRGLNEAGFAKGRNITMEYRWADGQIHRLPAMAAATCEVARSNSGMTLSRFVEFVGSRIEVCKRCRRDVDVARANR